MNFSLAYTGHCGVAYSRCSQSFPNFPGENCWVFPFAFNYCGDDTGGEQSRSASSNSLGLQEACAPVAAQDLTDAPVGHLKDAVNSKWCFMLSDSDKLFHPNLGHLWSKCLFGYPKDPGYLAWTDSLRGQFNHLPPLGFWERSAVKKNPSQLVDASTTLS